MQSYGSDFNQDFRDFRDFQDSVKELRILSLQGNGARKQFLRSLGVIMVLFKIKRITRIIILVIL